MGSSFILFLPDRIRSWMRPPSYVGGVYAKTGIGCPSISTRSVTVQLRRESAEAKVERIMAQELRRRKWDANSLAERAERHKGDPGKLDMARRLREHSTMTLSWIAQQLHMGTRTHLAHLLPFCTHSPGGMMPPSTSAKMAAATAFTASSCERQANLEFIRHKKI